MANELMRSSEDEPLAGDDSVGRAEDDEEFDEAEDLDEEDDADFDEDIIGNEEE